MQASIPSSANEQGSREIRCALETARENVGRRYRLRRSTEYATGSLNLRLYGSVQTHSFLVVHSRYEIMSAFHTFSPLLRRGGTVPSWTCRACSRSQGQAISQRSAFASRIQGERSFATRVEGARGAVNGPSGNANPTGNAAKSSTNSLGGAAGPNARTGPKSKRRRRLVIAGGALTIGAAAITINDDAKHAYTATQRSYRVLETLVLNIKEYVHSPVLHEIAVANCYYVQLPRDTGARR